MCTPSLNTGRSLWLDLTPYPNKQVVFVTYLTVGIVATPRIFYNKGPMMLYLVPLYRSWSPLYISAIRCSIQFPQFPCEVIYVKNWQDLLLITNMLGTSEFNWDFLQKFLEWIVKYLKRMTVKDQYKTFKSSTPPKYSAVQQNKSYTPKKWLGNIATLIMYFMKYI